MVGFGCNRWLKLLDGQDSGNDEWLVKAEAAAKTIFAQIASELFDPECRVNTKFSYNVVKGE